MNRNGDDYGAQNTGAQALTVVGDGGASGSRYAIFDANGRRIAQTHGKPASLSLGTEAACTAIREAISALGVQACNDPDWMPQNIMLGLAGAEQVQRKQQLISLLPQSLQCRIVTDGYAHLHGVTAGKPGICLSLGTGSVIHWHNADAQHGMAGGWGFPVGDESSGAWLGRALVNAWLWSIDAGQTVGEQRQDRIATIAAANITAASQRSLQPGKQLIAGLEKRIGKSRSDIQQWTINAVSTDYATLVDLLLQAAANEDPLAMQLQSLGTQDCLRLLALCPNELPVYVTGGLAPFYESQLRKHLGSRLATAKGDALDGLRLLAINQPS